MYRDFNPSLYDKFSRIRTSQFEIVLEKHKHLLKWKPKASILDIGCGTGNLSREMIYPLFPEDFIQFVCLDYNERMLQEAKKQYKDDERVSFALKDINETLDKEMHGQFDHIFSTYCLMWLKEQKTAFKNIHQLLSPQGSCFLMMVDRHAVIDTLCQLLDKPRWKTFVPDSDEIYPFPYRKVKDPVKTASEAMKSIGYVNVQVFLDKSDFAFKDEEEFLGYFKSIPSPLPLMTLEEQEDFLSDAVEFAYANQAINKSGETSVTGTLLLIYGEK